MSGNEIECNMNNAAKEADILDTSDKKKRRENSKGKAMFFYRFARTVAVKLS